MTPKNITLGISAAVALTLTSCTNIVDSSGENQASYPESGRDSISAIDSNDYAAPFNPILSHDVYKDQERMLKVDKTPQEIPLREGTPEDPIFPSNKGKDIDGEGDPRLYVDTPQQRIINTMIDETNKVATQTCKADQAPGTSKQFVQESYRRAGVSDVMDAKVVPLQYMRMGDVVVDETEDMWYIVAQDGGFVTCSASQDNAFIRLPYSILNGHTVGIFRPKNVIQPLSQVDEKAYTTFEN